MGKKERSFCASRATQTSAVSCLARRSSADVCRRGARLARQSARVGSSAEMGKREAEASEGSDPTER